MRILAAFCAALSVAVFAANYILPVSVMLPLTMIFAVIAIVLLLTKRKWLRGAVLMFAGMAVGLGAFLVKYSTVTLPCRACDGEERVVHGYLTQYPQSYEGYCSGEMMITDNNLPNVKAIVYDSSLILSSAVPGDTLELRGKLRSADMRYGKEYDRYNAREIFLIVNADNVKILGNEPYHPSAVFAKMRNAMGNGISRLYYADSSAFMKALMLGDKQELYKNTRLYNDLSESGIMHVAAVSGMHISFLVSVLVFLLGAGRAGAIISIALVWLFVFLTGGSPSAVRAGFMQSLVLLAPIVRRENDPITSLSAVLALVLLKNPYAAVSLSLQLSFGAMAGIMCFGSRIYTALTDFMSKRTKRVLKRPLYIIASSFAVMVFTLPLTAIHFGYVNVLSPITNILTMLAVSACFCGGFLSLSLSVIWLPLGKAAAFIVSLLVKYISAVVHFVSSLRFCTVYLTDTAMVLWLAASALILIIFLGSKLSDRQRLVLSAAMIFLLLTSVVLITEHSYSKDRCSFSVIDVGQGQSIAVLSGDKTVLVDCGGGGKNENAGQIVSAHLLSRGRYSIDALLLTHLHSDHANGVAELMEKLTVDRLILPKDAPDSDGILQPILESADRHGTAIQYIDSDCVLEWGNIRAELFAPGNSGGANERCLMCRIGVFDRDMLITADAPISAEKELAETHDLSGTDYLIAGHHGSRYSNGGKLLSAVGADTAIISVGYNSYGHPHYETLARLDAYGYNVLRTDENGTVEIRIR